MHDDETDDDDATAPLHTLPPDAAQRALRMADLITAHALPLADVAVFLNLPLSTVQKLRIQGRGPKTFLIGRRIYVLQTDLREWIDSLAKPDAT